MYKLSWFGNFKNIECAIKKSSPDKADTLGIYIPEGLTTLVVIILNILIIRHVRLAFQSQNFRGILKEIIFYPVPLIFVILLNILENVPEMKIYWVHDISVIFRDLIGMFNCFIYGFNITLRSEIKRRYLGKIESQKRESDTIYFIQNE